MMKPGDHFLELHPFHFKGLRERAAGQKDKALLLFLINTQELKTVLNFMFGKRLT